MPEQIHYGPCVGGGYHGSWETCEKCEPPARPEAGMPLHTRALLLCREDRDAARGERDQAVRDAEQAWREKVAAEDAMLGMMNERDALRRDAARLDWLERHTINVRTPTRYGSWDLFWHSPAMDDDDLEPEPLRDVIDRHMASNATRAEAP